MSYEYLKRYVREKYPHLIELITEAQYEQIDWVDDTKKTNEASLALQIERTFSFQQQRLLARLHFLFLLKHKNYETFSENQSIAADLPLLTPEKFDILADVIQNLTETEYQQIWVASITSISTKAILLAQEKLPIILPSDSVEFLAKVMTEAPDVYPAAQEIMRQDPTAVVAFSIMFNTGHLRHMMYVEGDKKMFDRLCQKISTGEIGQRQLNLWFSYWLIDITAFRLHTKDGLGSEYLKNYTAQALICLKGHLDQLLLNPEKSILSDYLTERSNWITSSLSNFSLVQSPENNAPRLVLARIAAMLRVFTPSGGAEICQGWDKLHICP